MMLELVGENYTPQLKGLLALFISVIAAFEISVRNAFCGFSVVS